SITNLTNLQSLSLSNTQIKEFPVSITNLTNLQSLNLWDTQIKEIPDCITNLTNLQSLSLNSTQIKEIPDCITNLTNLQSLFLMNTQIKEIPDCITNLTNLQSLHLRNTQIEEIPVSITNLTNLQSLSLSNTQIKEIPVSITNLTNLQSLDLSESQIKEIPDSIINLTNLQSLDLMHTQIKEIPISITNLTNLQSLNLMHTQIKEIPISIANLTNLQSLNLSNTQIKEIPISITNLTNLQSLNLSNTQIKKFPPKLLELNLSINNSKYTSKGINLFDLNFSDIPPEIVNQGKKFIGIYFKEEKEENKEFKIIFIGDGSAGKTSLIKRLMNKGFDAKESTTLGITITDQIFESEKKEYISHMWDFGGQEIMHSTHKFFLSERCLYILVLDARKEENIEYWLKHIESLGGNSPTLVVLNKIDTFFQAAVDEKFLREKYNHNIKDFYKISCKNNTNIDKIEEGIRKHIKDIEGIDYSLPIKWIDIKGKLEKMKSNYISFKDYSKLCESKEIYNFDIQNTLLNFLKDMGIICSFEELQIKNKKVLNPKWITNAIYKIMTNEEIKNNNGYLEKNKVGEIINDLCNNKIYIKEYCEFTDCKYDFDDQIYILNLMREFELCYSLDSKFELIPALMNKSEPDFTFDKKNSLRYMLKYSFLPKSIIHRLIVRNNIKIKMKNLVWNTGVVLSDNENETEALVKLDEEEKIINIYIIGNFGRNLLTKLRDDLRDINSSLKSINDEVTESIVKDNYPIDYNTILANYKNGVPEFYVGNGNQYSTMDLLGDIQPSDYTDKELKREIYINKFNNYGDGGIKMSDEIKIQNNNGQVNIAKDHSTLNAEQTINSGNNENIDLDELLEELFTLRKKLKNMDLDTEGKETLENVKLAISSANEENQNKTLEILKKSAKTISVLAVNFGLSYLAGIVPKS
ncbi:MAG: COR domain-containing protein, partial [Clostridiales bacterium]